MNRGFQIVQKILGKASDDSLLLKDFFGPQFLLALLDDCQIAHLNRVRLKDLSFDLFCRGGPDNPSPLD